jgi:hypothetical protein
MRTQDRPTYQTRTIESEIHRTKRVGMAPLTIDCNYLQINGDASVIGYDAQLR